MPSVSWGKRHCEQVFESHSLHRLPADGMQTEESSHHIKRCCYLDDKAMKHFARSKLAVVIMADVKFSNMVEIVRMFVSTSNPAGVFTRGSCSQGGGT